MSGRAGRSGRKPTPTAIRDARGTLRADRTNRDEPEFRHKLPSCPRFLDGPARALWKRLAPELYEAGVLTWLDREALACLCICWSTIKQADAEIQARGLALESSRGPVTNPAVRIRRAALDQFKALAVEFGMTPSARSRVNANPPRPETDEDRSDALVARLIAPPPRRSMQEYLDEQDCK